MKRKESRRHSTERRCYSGCCCHSSVTLGVRRSSYHQGSLSGFLVGWPDYPARQPGPIPRSTSLRERAMVRLSSLKRCALDLLWSVIERLGRTFAPLANLVITAGHYILRASL
ncbi:unnamed protein product [Tuber aestivum]|uniref:Uncharacterized protein n=1 Tax=Tuber aestivum TaxID=59557 RepID=A0A292PYR8_9PEZI|nr:unnamed protein product [Tuber aestivum]